jgi:hypothetical protein
VHYQFDLTLKKNNDSSEFFELRKLFAMRLQAPLCQATQQILFAPRQE